MSDGGVMLDNVADAVGARLLDALAEIAGAESVLSRIEQRIFFATDIAHRGVAAEAVVKVTDTAMLAKVVRACTEAGRIVIPRGGGFSYTGGYTPTRDQTVMIDMRPMHRIVEINTQDMYVIVETGCTWERLYEALKERGVRTPYFGPMSGYRATVGGALSQGSLFLGSTEHGTASESVLGLEVVLADGRIVRTGSWGGKEDVSPFFRHYGPDPTGMFLGDTGAMGFKTRAVLRLIPFPPAQAYATFAFETHTAALAALSEIGRARLAAECYCWDPYFVSRMMANSGGTKQQLKYLLNVVKAGSGPIDGVAAAMRMALSGKRGFSGDNWLLHVVIDDASAAGAAARLKLVRAIARKQAVREMAPNAPRILRGTPFTDFNTEERRSPIRNLPINSLSPHSRAPAVAADVYAYIAEHKDEMKRLDMQCGVIFFAISTQAVSIEPLIYWEDHEHALHDRIAETSDVAALASHTDRPEATQFAFKLGAGFKEIFRRHGCVHLQIGRSYPWAETREPNLLAWSRLSKIVSTPIASSTAVLSRWVRTPVTRIERKHFFFEKKKQKTFDRCRGFFLNAYAQDIKVFWFFFSKKNFLSFFVQEPQMRLRCLAFAVLLPTMAQAAPACQSVSPFTLSLDHLDGLRLYKGPDGDTEVEKLRIDARHVPMLKTGKSLSIIDLPASGKRADEIVFGQPNIDIGLHAAPGKEMFIMLAGSVTVTTRKFHAEMYPGSVLLFDDVGAKTGHGGRTGPCGYISLSIAP